MFIKLDRPIYFEELLDLIKQFKCALSLEGFGKSKIVKARADQVIKAAEHPMILQTLKSMHVAITNKTISTSDFKKLKKIAQKSRFVVDVSETVIRMPEKKPSAFQAHFPVYLLFFKIFSGFFIVFALIRFFSRKPQIAYNFSLSA